MLCASFVTEKWLLVKEYVLSKHGFIPVDTLFSLLGKEGEERMEFSCNFGEEPFAKSHTD